MGFPCFPVTRRCSALFFVCASGVLLAGPLRAVGSSGPPGGSEGLLEAWRAVGRVSRAARERVVPFLTFWGLLGVVLGCPWAFWGPPGSREA
eukprot:323710-Pyramimonas_sp.AAC.1